MRRADAIFAASSKPVDKSCEINLKVTLLNERNLCDADFLNQGEYDCS